MSKTNRRQAINDNTVVRRLQVTVSQLLRLLQLTNLRAKYYHCDVMAKTIEEINQKIKKGVKKAAEEVDNEREDKHSFLSTVLYQ